MLVAGVGAGTLILGWVTRSLIDGYMLGVVHGGLIATVVFAILTSFHLVTGSGCLLAGAWGEENTQDLLRRAKRKRLICGWVDNVEIASGDVDHLVLTRAGAWIALDSKWHAQSSLRYQAADVQAAHAAARRARNILRSLNHVRPAVAPAVVLWGGARHELSEPWATVDGVDVVQGQCLIDWLAKRHAGVAVDSRTARGMLKELRRFRLRVRPPQSKPWAA